jgi:hypothetical protein
MVPALHSEESMGQLRSKSGTGKHFVYIPGNGAKRQLISVRVGVHYQGTGVYRSPERVFSRNYTENPLCDKSLDRNFV